MTQAGFRTKRPPCPLRARSAGQRRKVTLGPPGTPEDRQDDPLRKPTL